MRLKRFNIFIKPFFINNYTIKIFYDILSKKEENKEITDEKRRFNFRIYRIRFK